MEITLIMQDGSEVNCKLEDLMMLVRLGFVVIDEENKDGIPTRAHATQKGHEAARLIKHERASKYN